MKTMKGGILNKLRSVPQMQLKQGRILQLKASDGFFFNSTPLPSSRLLDCREDQPQIIDAAELMRDLDDVEDKENIKPASTTMRSPLPWRKQNDDEHNHKFHPYRRPDLNSPTLFDPNLLAAFEQAAKDYLRIFELLKQFEKEEQEKKEEVEPPLKIPKIRYVLNEFEEKCPPGGSGAVILYSTSLRGVRKTFEGCSAIRFLLESSKVLFYERDVAMHREFKEELRRLLGFGAIPPRLFVDGRDIGGAEEVLGLHEQGKLMPVLQEMPRDQSGGLPCWRCGGIKFLVCEWCDGGRKMYDEGGGAWRNCSLCNENGLIVCHICCC
ncbi:uncharacterized protein At5g39865 [Phalaenopsis equestris]|uniref:uncharacterized protein At5g39865 n=1 Tax=Phalaenopsis equestris TaxID=78828 RepID=UPI0009E1A627|nr:uncharacterized protein At5g39865 [Phalaenopsis equestris]